MKKNIISIIPYILVLVWAVVAWWFFQFHYEYSFYYKEQNQLFLWSQDYVMDYLGRPAWAAQLAGDFITQFFYYTYVGAAVFVGLLLVTGDLTRRALQRITGCKWLSFGVALVLMSVLAVFNFNPDYRMAGVMSVLGVVALVYLCTLFLSFRWWIKGSVAVVALVLAGWMFGFGASGIGKFSKPYQEIEDYLAVDNLYYFGNYGDLAERVLRMEKVSPVISCYYYMAMAQNGILPQTLGNVESVDLGTLLHIGPESTIQEMKLMNEFYFLLGDMTLAERAALLGCVSSPNNRNVRMIKRLAEVNLVAGDEEAAMKYLRLLDKTWAYRKWAKLNRPGKMNARLEAKKAFACKEDKVRLNDHCRVVLMGLLEANPNNKVALDYLLCTDILVKELGTFYQDYITYYLPVYGEAKEPVYQEMLRMKKEYDESNGNELDKQ